MSQQDAFDHIVAALHETALNDSLWPRTSTLIDEAVGMWGSHLAVESGHTRDDAEFVFGDAYCRGELVEMGRMYANIYFPHDERVQRLLRLPDSRVVHVTHVYTEHELQTSPTYNELLSRFGAGNGLNLRMDGPDGLHIIWAFTDPDDPRGWRSEQIALIKQLLPHIRQFVRVRQALASAEALGTSLISLLDNAQLGVLFLDRHGTIVETNTRGLRILRRSDSLEHFRIELHSARLLVILPAPSAIASTGDDPSWQPLSPPTFGFVSSGRSKAASRARPRPAGLA